MKSLNPNNLGDFLVENCKKISIKDYLQKANAELKKLIIQSSLDRIGIQITLSSSQTHFNGLRYWFSCPICTKRIGVLFVHPINNNIGCRKCFGLKYSKSRYKGMVENSGNTSEIRV